MHFFENHRFLFLILLILSFYIYDNYTMIVEPHNKDTNSISYVNRLYKSDERIYNKFLNKKEKKIYRAFFNTIKDYKTKLIINTDEYNCELSECASMMHKIYDAMIIDHPDLLNFAGPKRYHKNGSNLEVSIDYSTNNAIQEQIGILKIEKIIYRIKKQTKNMTDYEKIKYVYEWMGDNNEYDQLFTEFAKNQSPYNVFLRKNAVCAGFAKSSQLIFQNIGIESMGIVGNTTGPHMWNIVKYKGKYYYFDSTAAVSFKNKKKSYYYYGMKQTQMTGYTQDYPEWYPKIEATDMKA